MHALGVGRLVLGVGVEQERQHRAGQPGCRLDDVRHPALALLLVEVGQVDAGVLGVRGQVEVGAVGDALELANSCRRSGSGTRCRRSAWSSARASPAGARRSRRFSSRSPRSTYQFQPLLQPVLVPLLVGPGLDEELHLHLLELTGTEDEVARRDLVAERLADLRDAERRLLARADCMTFMKLTKMPCAVSGRR